MRHDEETREESESGISAMMDKSRASSCTVRADVRPCPDKEAEYWGKAVNTLASMCIAYLDGRGPTKAAFIYTLRMYADGLEALGPNNMLTVSGERQKGQTT